MQKPYDQDQSVKVKEKISKLLSRIIDLKSLIPNDESLNLICVISKKNCVDCLENNFQIEY